MGISTILYLVKQGLENILRDGRKNIATFIVVMCTMLVLGGFVVLYVNANYIKNTVEKAQAIKAFIADTATQDDIDSMKVEISQIKGVTGIQFVSMKEAFEEAKSILKEKAYLLEGMENSQIFPASFIITIDNIKSYEAISDIVKDVKGITNVRSGDSVTSVVRVGDVMQKILIVVGLIFIMISIVIISNTIKLAVYSNRTEISIMRYIGATDMFIQLPYIVEGVTIGLSAAVVSFSLTYGSYFVIYDKTGFNTSIGSISMAPYSQILLPVIITYVLTGILLGIIGSIISINKYLKA